MIRVLTIIGLLWKHKMNINMETFRFSLTFSVRWWMAFKMIIIASNQERLIRKNDISSYCHIIWSFRFIWLHFPCRKISAMTLNIWRNCQLYKSQRFSLNPRWLSLEAQPSYLGLWRKWQYFSSFLLTLYLEVHLEFL